MDEMLWANIQRLHHQEELSHRAIARHLGIHRDQVKLALSSERCPKRTAGARGSLLDAYEEPLAAILAEYPTLSGVRVFEKLLEVGYPGKISILRDRLRELRPRRQPEAFIKRETLPGQEAQADWGSCGQISHEGVIRPLSVFVMALSFSRLLYVEFTVSQEMGDFLRCHVNAFNYFTGCPKVVLYDNLRSVVQWRQGRLTRFNARFQEFAGAYLFEPRACNPRRGNEKPRAETGVRYVKQNFLAGRQFRDFNEVKVAAFHWLRETANVRVHRTTGERPIDRFEREKALLRALPATPYDTRICRSVYVDHQARVSFQNNTYSVPPSFVGQTLVLKASPDRVCLYHTDREVASHVRSYSRYRDVEDPAHGRAIVAHKQRGHLDKQRDEFLALGSPATRFLQGLVERGHGSPAFHVERLLHLITRYGATEVLAAMERALEFHAYGAEYVENILRQRLKGQPESKSTPLELSTRPDLATHTVETTDWSDYEYLANLDEEDTDEHDDE